MVYDKNGKVIKSSKQIKSDFDRFNYDNFLDKDGYPNDDLVDECIRIVEWYKGEEPDFNESFDRYYERRINKGEDKKEARKSATKSALIDICGDVSEFRKMVESYCSSKGCDDIPNALSFANLPPEEKDERTPQEKWEDYVYSKGEIKSSKTIISNKEPADMDMAYQLEGFIESDGQLYTQMIIPVIKNLEKKVKKGIFDKEKSLILWQNVADEGAKRYVKELGGPSYNVATRKEVAKKLSEYYEENYMGDNPIESSKQIKSDLEAYTFAPQEGETIDMTTREWPRGERGEHNERTREMESTLFDFFSANHDQMDPHYADVEDINIVEGSNGLLKVEMLINGDWKHDHLCADHWMRNEFGFDLIDTREVGESDSDYYEAYHTYLENPGLKQFNEMRKGIKSSKKNINSSWEEDVDFVVDEYMNEWMEKHPDSTTEEYTAARKKYHDWVYERV